MKINIYTGNKAFSLLEVTVVIIILTILASAAIPVLSRAYMERAGTKTALDMSAIEEAARAYYINNNAWPGTAQGHTALGDLTAGNYLPSSWNAVNPFGAAAEDTSLYAYVVSVSGASASSYLTVSTYVPSQARSVIVNSLPSSGLVLNNGIEYVYSAVAVPGVSSSLPAGMILPWASNTLPAGFLWCNGQVLNVANYQNLYNVIGAAYDVAGDGADGVNSFALPDLMGRTIVGVDGMGGVAAANRITQWGSAPGLIGGTMGEDVHALTIAEMPPHDFQTLADNSPNAGAWLDFQGNGAWKGFSGGGTGKGLYKYRTGFRGGNNDGSANSTVVPHNVVQPSMALGYIIKY